MNPEELAKRYEQTIGPIIHKAAPPTTDSIAKIERTLNIKLPPSLLRFTTAAPNYGNWLASIGPDYDSPTHILNINQPEQFPTKPQNFIIINIGYDQDYDCIDLETQDKQSGDYLITYWSPDIDLRESGLHENFMDYMSLTIQFWAKNT